MAETALPTFRLLDALVHNREKPPEILARGLGVAFTHSERTSNEVSTVFEGGQSNIDPSISGVTLRLARQGEGQENLIALDINGQKSCIKLRDVVAYYGNFSGMTVPTPRQPASAPIVYSYHHNWGMLKFAISRQGQSCVEAIRVEYR